MSSLFVKILRNILTFPVANADVNSERVFVPCTARVDLTLRLGRFPEESVAVVDIAGL